MRVLCKYSGVEFTAQHFNQLFLKSSQTAHPIMYVDTKTLLSRTADWSNASLSTEEEKLLFVALLKSTDLVEFRRAANPSAQTVKRNMDRLLLTVGWRHATGDSFPVPKFAIDNYTADLISIPAWLDAWNDAKRDWETKGISWSLSQKLALREAALIKLLRSPSRKEDTYARTMAKYVLEVTQAPSYILAYWTELFCLREDKKIWDIPTKDFMELWDWLELHLDTTTLIGGDAKRRIKRLIEINMKGIAGSIGMDDESFFQHHSPTSEFTNESVREGRGFSGAKFTLLETKSSRPISVLSSSLPNFSSVEEHNIQVILAKAPKEKPTPEAFSSRVEYLRAVANYDIAKRYLDKQAIEEKKRKEKLEAMEIDEDNLEEEIVDQLELFEAEIKVGSHTQPKKNQREGS